MIKANIEHHDRWKHAAQLDELQGQMHLDKVNTLWQCPNKRSFTRPHSDIDGVTQTSFVVSELIATS